MVSIVVAKLQVQFRKVLGFGGCALTAPTIKGDSMNEFDQRALDEAVNNVVPHLSPDEGGKRFRGPNRTFDFLYQVWAQKALIQTRQLPALMENERILYLKQRRLLESVGQKSRFPTMGGTHSVGWSQNRDFLWDFSISRNLYNYFAQVVGPFLGYPRRTTKDESSRLWKRIKNMIIEGDKVRIAKFASSIEKRLLKESAKKIMVTNMGIGENNGTEDSNIVRA